MSNDNPLPHEVPAEPAWAPPHFVTVEVVPEPAPPAPPAPRQPRRLLPLLLFVATCLSTYYVGTQEFGLVKGLEYSACLMTILVCHEMGHFLQARRYGVRASFPYFIPVPIPPIGTMGAVIGMSSSIPNRRALYDIGISGPLAGLVPTLLFCVLGLRSAPVLASELSTLQYGDPLLLKLLTHWIKGPLPPGSDIFLTPALMAGWVGLLITSVNLFPIGQLDGGHVLYALLRRKAHVVAMVVLVAGLVAVFLFKLAWWPMLILLVFMGPKHPPTADDNTPLGTWRIVLGWLTLAFLVLGFTPRPFP